MIAMIANSAWLASCLAEYARFRRALNRIRDEQAEILGRLLTENESSEFGRTHGFQAIRRARDYQRRVPIHDYEGYRTTIDRIADGGVDLLTREPIELFQPTSGSAGARKWIPYTRSLEREFQRGIRAWVADMFLLRPGLMNGAAYWSVSPIGAGEEMTPSGIRVGFADDSEYVGGVERKLVRSIMAVPSTVRQLRDPAEFWYATLVHLIRRPDLRFISIWNPSFLSLLMDRLEQFCDRLRLDVPEARKALDAPSAAERHALLWPHLEIISCWTDGNSSGAAARLAKLFPQSRIEGKGLLATEGIVSFPFGADRVPHLAVRSHFLEFLPVSSDDEPDFESPLLAHELDRGGRYSAVLSTGGGLYRYHLGDQIEVTGFDKQCPLVRFVGRNAVSDWCGEKLHEAHAARLLASAFRDFDTKPGFAMLACDAASRTPHYVLYIESDIPQERLRSLVATIEEGLQENFHYRYARRLGQLGPVRAFAAQNAAASYMAACAARGQIHGDIKSAALDRRGDWTSKFQGSFVETESAAGIAR